MKIEVQIEIRKNIYKNAIYRDFLQSLVKNHFETVWGILWQFETFEGFLTTVGF